MIHWLCVKSKWLEPIEVPPNTRFAPNLYRLEDNPAEKACQEILRFFSMEMFFKKSLKIGKKGRFFEKKTTKSFGKVEKMNKSEKN